MKKKEKEHLKEDPFQIFIEKTITGFQKYKKHIYTTFLAIIILVVVLVMIGFLRSGSISSENKLFSTALQIQEDPALTTTQKLEELEKLTPKKGISSTIPLLIATLYFESGETEKAKGALDNFETSKVKIINEKKDLLTADILTASGQEKKALEQLHKMYTDPNCDTAKDYILLKISKIQIKTGAMETAVTNLKKISEEYPTSYYTREAQELLEKVEIK